MNRTWTSVVLLSLTLLIGGPLGCEGQERSPKEEPAPNSAAEVGKPMGSCGPLEVLASLDNRQPLPLKPLMAWHQKQNMMAHLVAIQGIVEALSREDWAGVATASKPIESSPHMERMCEHMGAGAEGFTELALAFHHRAEGIGVAARAQDGPGVLRATADTLETCTSCHSTYRQEVVDDRTWQERSQAGHPSQ